MKKKVELYRSERKDGYFYIIPVERNSVSYFAVKHNEIEGIREYSVSIDEEEAVAYLYYFLIKFFDEELIENKIKMGNVSYKDKTNFEWDGKDNFYTLDNIRLMKDSINEVLSLLQNDFDNYDLDEYKKMTYEKIPENEFKENIEEIIAFYNNICDYFDSLLDLEDDKYIISFSNHNNFVCCVFLFNILYNISLSIF